MHAICVVPGLADDERFWRDVVEEHRARLLTLDGGEIVAIRPVVNVPLFDHAAVDQTAAVHRHLAVAGNVEKLIVGLSRVTHHDGKVAGSRMEQSSVGEPLESVGRILVSVDILRVACRRVLPDVARLALEMQTTEDISIVSIGDSTRLFKSVGKMHTSTPRAVGLVSTVVDAILVEPLDVGMIFVAFLLQTCAPHDDDAPLVVDHCSLDMLPVEPWLRFPCDHVLRAPACTVLVGSLSVYVVGRVGRTAENDTLFLWPVVESLLVGGARVFAHVVGQFL